MRTLNEIVHQTRNNIKGIIGIHITHNQRERRKNVFKCAQRKNKM